MSIKKKHREDVVPKDEKQKKSVGKKERERRSDTGSRVRIAGEMLMPVDDGEKARK